MKSIPKLNDKKVPVVRIDKSLNKYSNVVLFPEKVEKAKQAFEKLGIPDLQNNGRWDIILKSRLTNIIREFGN